jgi:hypothetical protein
VRGDVDPLPHRQRLGLRHRPTGCQDAWTFGPAPRIEELTAE